MFACLQMAGLFAWIGETPISVGGLFHVERSWDIATLGREKGRPDVSSH